MATFTFTDPFGPAAFPTIDVPDSVLEVLENKFSIDTLNYDGECAWFELKSTTDAGIVMPHVICIDLTAKDMLAEWRQRFYELWEDFDPWHETWVMCDFEGNPTMTPFTRGIDLYHDIEGYDKDVLEATYDELMAL